MNNIFIFINSYAQTAQIRINDSEPSPYSELSNYTYEQFIKTPNLILDALARELNDDFALEICGNSYECGLFEAEAQKSAYCSSFTASAPALQISTAERAQRLGISLSAFEATGNSQTDLSESARETLFINPEIGRAVARLSNPTLEQAICARVTPILTASLPTAMEVGEAAQVSVEVYPEGCKTASVVVHSSNPDVLSVEGTTLRPLAAGGAIVHVFVAGENRPFFSQNVAVSKTVNVTKIEILGMDEPLREGEKVPLQANLLPRDADDLTSLKWTSSDPAIVEIVDGVACPKAPGECVITAATTQATCSMNVTVQSKLKALTLSKKTVSVNVGRKEPITVSIDPPTAYDASYKWSSSDKTVAVIIEEEGVEYIKAVGIGSCKLTCTSESGECADSCDVTVNSIMYKQKKDKKEILWAVAAIVILVLVFFNPFGKKKADNVEPDDVQEQQEEQVEVNPVVVFEPPAEGVPQSTLDEFTASAFESAYATIEEFKEYGYDKCLLEPEVVSAFFIKTTNPDKPHKDWGMDIEYYNALGILVHYTLERHIGYTEEYDSWRVYFFPDCYYDTDGIIKCSAEKRFAPTVYSETSEGIIAELEFDLSDMKAYEVALP